MQPVRTTPKSKNDSALYGSSFSSKVGQKLVKEALDTEQLSDLDILKILIRNDDFSKQIMDKYGSLEKIMQIQDARELLDLPAATHANIAKIAAMFEYAFRVRNTAIRL